MFGFRLGTLIPKNETILAAENNLKVMGPTQEIGNKNQTSFD